MLGGEGSFNDADSQGSKIPTSTPVPVPSVRTEEQKEAQIKAEKKALTEFIKNILKKNKIEWWEYDMLSDVNKKLYKSISDTEPGPGMPHPGYKK